MNNEFNHELKNNIHTVTKCGKHGKNSRNNAFQVHHQCKYGETNAHMDSATATTKMNSQLCNRLDDLHKRNA